MTLRHWSLALLVPLAALGCGGPATTEPTTGPTATQTAEDVAGMLKDYHAAAKKAPIGLADLTDAPASHPVGHAAVASGEFIVLWRVPISSSGSDAVLAYHKDVPTSGGSVVMQNGTVKVMTAGEFASAPKAR